MRRGFTLVELSIVLVIIGFVIGGILVGESMRSAAQILRLNQEFEQHITHIRLFKERFRAIPGDMSNASTLLGAAHNGNGNNEIGYTGDNVNGYEGAYAFNHMYLAGFYPTAYGNSIGGEIANVTNPPSQFIKVGGTLVTSYDFGGVDNKGYNVLTLSCLTLGGGIYATAGASCLPAKVSQALDAKFDDANAITGNIMGDISSNNAQANYPSSNCAWPYPFSNAGQYTTNHLCRPSYRFDDMMP